MIDRSQKMNETLFLEIETISNKSTYVVLFRVIVVERFNPILL
jgi:hypothetical protein